MTDQPDKLADDLADAEMYLDSTIGELEETIRALRSAKKVLRVKRMNLARAIKKGTR